MTLLGLSASIFGGAFVGAVFYVTAVVSPTLFVFEHLQALAIEQWRLIPLGLMAGLTGGRGISRFVSLRKPFLSIHFFAPAVDAGSVLDSVLGATLQYSGYNEETGRVTSKMGPRIRHISGLPFLSNNAVNVVSASLTSLLTSLAAVVTFGYPS